MGSCVHRSSAFFSNGMTMERVTELGVVRARVKETGIVTCLPTDTYCKSKREKKVKIDPVL